MLSSRRESRIRLTAVAHDAVGGQTHPAGGCDNAAAPVAEHIAIGRNLDRRAGGEEIRHDDVGGTREVRSQHHDHGCRLREVVEHFESDTKLHRNTVLVANVLRWSNRYKALRLI